MHVVTWLRSDPNSPEAAMNVIQVIYDWSARKLDEQKLNRFGGIQTCPWCRQTANQGDDWSFDQWERDAFIDVLTCGCCGGTSLWHFGVGMHFIGPLEPPKPSHGPVDYYDIEAARLRPAEQSK